MKTIKELQPAEIFYGNGYYDTNMFFFNELFSPDPEGLEEKPRIFYHYLYTKERL